LRPRHGMNTTRILPATILILLTILALAPTAKADYNIQLQTDTFKVTWTINAVQNLTTYPVPATVYPPNLNQTLTGNDLNQFTTAIQTTLQQTNSALTVTDTTLQMTSNNINRTCTTCHQWLNSTATFQVHDPGQTRNGVTQYDLSWLPLSLTQDLSVSGVTYNRLGQDYLLTAILPIIAFVPSSDQTQTVQVNGNTITKIGYQPVIASIVYFDTSAVKKNLLENWIFTQDLSSQTRTWTSPQNGGFIFTATQHIISENAVLLYLAGAKVTTQISTPLNAVAKGNNLYVDRTGGIWDQISLVIILASIGLLAGTVVIDRRVTSVFKQKRKTKKR
jgi:hypothetical protein